MQLNGNTGKLTELLLQTRAYLEYVHVFRRKGCEFTSLNCVKPKYEFLRTINHNDIKTLSCKVIDTFSRRTFDFLKPESKLKI